MIIGLYDNHDISHLNILYPMIIPSSKSSAVSQLVSPPARSPAPRDAAPCRRPHRPPERCWADAEAADSTAAPAVPAVGSF